MKVDDLLRLDREFVLDLLGIESQRHAHEVRAADPEGAQERRARRRQVDWEPGRRPPRASERSPRGRRPASTTGSRASRAVRRRFELPRRHDRECSGLTRADRAVRDAADCHAVHGRSPTCSTAAADRRGVLGAPRVDVDEPSTDDLLLRSRRASAVRRAPARRRPSELHDAPGRRGWSRSRSRTLSSASDDLLAADRGCWPRRLVDDRAAGARAPSHGRGGRAGAALDLAIAGDGTRHVLVHRDGAELAWDPAAGIRALGAGRADRAALALWPSGGVRRRSRRSSSGPRGAGDLSVALHATELRLQLPLAAPLRSRVEAEQAGLLASLN